LAISRARFLLVRKDGSSAGINCRKENDSAEEMILSDSAIVDMIDTLVESTFVRFGGLVYEQIVGIPMRTNCAGFLANLYCFTYELAFLERLVSQRRFDVASSFLRCVRYIDDLLCLGVDRFQEFMYLSSENPNGIYPREFLSLSLADSGPCVPFMDIALRFSRSHGLYTAIYDKRLDKKYSRLAVIRYPDHDSFISAQAKYGIVTSQLHRFSRRCTFARDFVYNIALVLHRMEGKGYRARDYWARVRTFLRRQPQLYGGGRSMGCWLRLIRQKLSQLSDGTLHPGPFGPEVG
jgi:hypothetical protein